MGASVPAGPIALRAELSRLSHPWHLHMLKNGYPHTIVEDPASADRAVELRDTAAPGDYYRLELHALEPYNDFPYHRWREWYTLLAFSNPIFAG